MIAHIPSPTTPETSPTHFSQPSIWPAGPAIPGGATGLGLGTMATRSLMSASMCMTAPFILANEQTPR